MALNARMFVPGLAGVILTAFALATVSGAQHGGRTQAAGMMSDQQKMMAEMQASSMKLDDLVKKMNAATGQAKVDDLAGIVTELVAQHRGMHEKMMTMMMSMHGTMTPDRPGGSATTPDSGIPPAEPSTGDDHSQHHPAK
jgi:hypothetical protein